VHLAVAEGENARFYVEGSLLDGYCTRLHLLVVVTRLLHPLFLDYYTRLLHGSYTRLLHGYCTHFYTVITPVYGCNNPFDYIIPMVVVVVIMVVVVVMVVVVMMMVVVIIGGGGGGDIN